MLSSNFRYDFPKGGSHPFDPAARGNYFAFANSAFSNTAEGLEQLYGKNNFRDHIQMGRLSIFVCYRLALIENGEVTTAWNAEDFNIKQSDSNLTRKFCVYANSPVEWFEPRWNRTIKTLQIYRRQTEEPEDYHLRYWTAFEECRKFAAGYSDRMQATLLIAVILDSIPWY